MANDLAEGAHALALPNGRLEEGGAASRQVDRVLLATTSGVPAREAAGDLFAYSRAYKHAGQ
jgi:hypothetical protein